MLEVLRFNLQLELCFSQSKKKHTAVFLIKVPIVLAPKIRLFFRRFWKLLDASRPQFFFLSTIHDDFQIEGEN